MLAVIVSDEFTKLQKLQPHKWPCPVVTVPCSGRVNIPSRNEYDSGGLQTAAPDPYFNELEALISATESDSNTAFTPKLSCLKNGVSS